MTTILKPSQLPHWEKLETLPDEIYKLETAIIEKNNHLTNVEEVINLEQSCIEAQIAGDASLTNDQKRKARRAELQASSVHLADAWAEKTLTTTALKMAEAKLSLLKNELSIAKLKARLEIAQLSAEF